MPMIAGFAQVCSYAQRCAQPYPQVMHIRDPDIVHRVDGTSRPEAKFPILVAPLSPGELTRAFVSCHVAFFPLFYLVIPKRRYIMWTHCVRKAMQGNRRKRETSDGFMFIATVTERTKRQAEFA